MGDRAQVHVAGAGVYFYIHVGGHKVYAQVADALARAQDAGRIEQTDTLARIIFDAINDNPGGTRGLGMSDSEYDGVYRTVAVNPRNGTVEVDTIYDDDDDEGTYTIDEFVAAYHDASDG